MFFGFDALVQRAVEALERIAAADERRNKLLEEDRADRRKMYAQDRADRREERDAVIGAFAADAERISGEIREATDGR